MRPSLRPWTRAEEEALVVIEAPPCGAGTATLRVVGNNLWNYLPKIAVAGSYEASPEITYSGAAAVALLLLKRRIPCFRHFL